jgi:stage V sporulation protein B
VKFQNLFWSAAILLICNFISRVLGFAYKIILVRLIGTEGIGITEMISPIYAFALVAGGLGIPMAMSRLLALELGRRRYQNLARIQNTGMALLLLLGGVTSLLCYIAAPLLLERFSAAPRGLEYLRTLTPAIFIVSVCSGFRAYFQATKQIGIIGVSQNIEQLVRVLVGSTLVWLALPLGLESAIKAVAAATVLGELAGLIYILTQYRRQRPHNRERPTRSRTSVALSLFSFGAPVTLQRWLASAILMLQAMLIPLALQNSGMSQAAATDAYGNFSGVALSLIHLPGIFTSTLAMALLPSIAECEDNRARLNRRINQSLHITTTIALPFMLIFFNHAEELCAWLFNAPAAAPPLKVLACAAIFIYAQTALTGILQGMGKLNALLCSLLISGALFIISIQTLVPKFALPGAALAYLIFAAAACLIDFAFLHHRVGLRLDARSIILKPLLAASAFLLTEKTAERVLSAALQNQILVFLSASAVGFLAYLWVLWLVKGLPGVFLRYIKPLRR